MIYLHITLIVLVVMLADPNMNVLFPLLVANSIVGSLYVMKEIDATVRAWYPYWIRCTRVLSMEPSPRSLKHLLLLSNVISHGILPLYILNRRTAVCVPSANTYIILVLYLLVADLKSLYPSDTPFEYYIGLYVLAVVCIDLIVCKKRNERQS